MTEQPITRQHTPTELRATRERLGLSRQDVEDHTHLAASVVWRAEQQNRQVSDEQYFTIVTFLAKVEAEGKPSCCGKKSGSKTNKFSKSAITSHEMEQLKAALAERDSLIKQLRSDLVEANKTNEMLGKNSANLHAALAEAEAKATNVATPIDWMQWTDKLAALVQSEIDIAKSKKASTAALKRIVDFINA